jgi:hypothetical protein
MQNDLSANPPAIREVERWAIRPGDRVLVRSEKMLTSIQAQQVRRTIASWAGLDVPVIIDYPELRISVVGVE